MITDERDFLKRFIKVFLQYLTVMGAQGHIQEKQTIMIRFF